MKRFAPNDATAVAVPVVAPMSLEASIVGYYAERASEYERVYQKPERQADLQVLRQFVENTLAGKDVLELACGTGYWTEIYQIRRLDDGTHEVRKNFPTESQLRAAVEGLASEVRVEFLQYYWILTYQSPQEAELDAPRRPGDNLN